MIYEEFQTKAFRRPAQQLIMQADEIIREYKGQGYTLTLRQLYYQFVARGIIENTERSYKNLGGVVTDGRMAGLLPWDGIEDRGRGVKGWLIEEDMEALIEDLPRGFAVDMWAQQDYYIEVWVEKEALGNVVQRACGQRRVPYMSCKGYLSASEAWRAGRRFKRASEAGKNCLIVHLGDHDPSGIDMSRDNDDRTNLFSWGDVELRRIALNMDQVEEYNPPPNPAKITDSRAADYIARFGRTSWELDALEPRVVVDLIQSTVNEYVDDDQWAEDQERENEGEELLRGVSLYWGDIQELIRQKQEDGA